MDLELNLFRAQGVDYEFCELTDSTEFDMLTLKGPEEWVKFAVNSFKPIYGLIDIEVLEGGNADQYLKSVYIPKAQSKLLREYILILFRRASGATDN